MRVALLLVGLGSTAFAGPSPVVGGQPAPPGKWPDIVALPFEGSADTVYCTGVLIAPTVVLTAGHCVNAPPPPGRVLIGVDSLAEPATGELLDVAAIHEYPSSQTSLDLAVLVLATPSTRTPRAVATGWARADILDDAAVALVGFGALDRDATQFSDVLHEATTTITDHDCSRALKGCRAAAQPAGELGAGGGGIDTCPGDSGGPLYLETTYGTFLAGITSRGYDDAKFLCSEGGIYERPDKVLAWIEEVSGATIGRGPEPTAAPLDDAYHLQITPHDPKPTAHRYAIATPPAHGTAGVRDDGQVIVCPGAAGDDEIVVAIADASVPARVAELRIPFHADAAATACSVEDFLDTGGCCSASGDRSSMLLAIAVAAVMRRRRRW